MAKFRIVGTLNRVDSSYVGGIYSPPPKKIDFTFSTEEELKTFFNKNYSNSLYNYRTLDWFDGSTYIDGAPCKRNEIVASLNCKTKERVKNVSEDHLRIAMQHLLEKNVRKSYKNPENPYKEEIGQALLLANCTDYNENDIFEVLKDIGFIRVQSFSYYKTIDIPGKALQSALNNTCLRILSPKSYVAEFRLPSYAKDVLYKEIASGTTSTYRISKKVPKPSSDLQEALNGKDIGIFIPGDLVLMGFDNKRYYNILKELDFNEEIRVRKPTFEGTTLYHGTWINNVASILDRGLDVSKTGAFSSGIYCGPWNKAQWYGSPSRSSSSMYGAIFELNVNLGKVIHVHETGKGPKELNCDSVYYDQFKNPEYCVRSSKQVEILKVHIIV